MRKTAREIIRELQARVDGLEKVSSNSQGITVIENLRRYLLEYEIPVFEKDGDEDYIKRAMGANIRGAERQLITLILEKIEVQLEHIEAKTKEERLILDRLAPDHFSFNYEGGMYQEIRNQGHEVWQKHELFRVLGKFVKQVDTGRHLHELRERTNFFLDKAVVACRELGI